MRVALLKPLLLSALMLLPVSAMAQRTYSPRLSIGGRAGATLSTTAFTPSIEQGMLPGFVAGAVIRYAEEKCVGVMGEINIVQRGWKEKYDPGETFEYSRTATYLSIPVMTHIFFGPKRFKCFINLGPEIAFLLGSSIKSNFNYENPMQVQGYPANRETEQLYAPIKNKIDYGITAGIGGEWRATPRHSITLEARYYFGLGNIFPSAKRDTFSASRYSSFEITAGYMFRIK